MLSVLKDLHQDRVVRPPKPRPDAMPKWLAAVEGSNFSAITLAEIRSLYWEKEVVLSAKFIELLFERKMNIRRSAIKGFIFALASRWDEVLRGKIAIRSFDDSLSRLSKSEFLNQIRPFILHEKGHARFADQVVSKRAKFSTLFTEIFGLVLPDSPYTSEVLRIVSESGRSAALSANRNEREWFYESVLSLLNKASLMACLGHIVREIEKSDTDDAKEELKGFILTHPNLGDPRLPGYEGNWDRNDPVTLAVIEWLSQSDISFFFELFFENQRDVQGRKRFWLKYAHLIRGTRVVVSEPDRVRLRRQLMDIDPKKVSKQMFGTMLHSSQMPTAFIMDFGKLIVVEFSLAGHACYYYGRESGFKFSDRAVFWNTKEFRPQELKDKSKCPRTLKHHEGWEPKFANMLASHGIRPRTGRR